MEGCLGVVGPRVFGTAGSLIGYTRPHGGAPLSCKRRRLELGPITATKGHWTARLRSLTMRHLLVQSAPMTNHRPVALVTGSTSGIGAAIARRLSSDGYSIVLHSRSSAEAGQAMARELESAIYIQADLANDADRVRLIRETVASWGRLDVLVNNAGISRVIPHVNMAAATPAIWQELYEVNVIAPFRLIAEAEHELRAAARRGRSGSVVNISSHAGVRPKGASIPYSATKAALNHMTCLLALSLGPDIRVDWQMGHCESPG